MTISMIETLLYVLSGILAGGSIAAYWSYAAGKKELAVSVRVSETRLKSAEQRAVLLKDQLELAQSDLLLIKNRLDQERHAKLAEMGEMRQQFQRSALLFAGYALGIGIMFGGTVSWICTGARAEARHLKRVIELQVESRVAMAKNQMLEMELEQFRNQNQVLGQTLQSEIEQKTAALAKLHALLGGLSSEQAAEGSLTDQLKLIRDLSRYPSDEKLVPSPKDPAALSLSRTSPVR